MIFMEMIEEKTSEEGVKIKRWEMKMKRSGKKKGR